MKRLYLLMAAALWLALLPATAQENYSNARLSTLWRTKSITLKNADQQPNVVSLLKAFHRQWPTPVVGQVLAHAERLADDMPYEDPDDWRVLVNRRTGYADLASETDIPTMQCALWKRKNGHNLFMAALYDPADKSVPQLITAYDYDPATEKMTPETTIIDNDTHLTNTDPTVIFCTLPMDGTNIEINEYTGSHVQLAHTYKWDGMTFNYDTATLTDFRYQEFGEGDWNDASQIGWSHYDLIQVEGIEEPLLCLKRPAYMLNECEEIAVFSSFKDDMQIIGIDNCDYTFEGFFRKPISAGGSERTIARCTDPTSSYFYSVFNEQAIDFFVIKEVKRAEDNSLLQGWNSRIVGYGSNYETTDINLMQPADKPLPFNPQWKPVTFTDKESSN